MRIAYKACGFINFDFMDNIEPKKEMRGGAGRGQGRKKGVATKVISPKISLEAYNLLITVHNQSKFITEAIIEKFERENKKD